MGSGGVVESIVGRGYAFIVVSLRYFIVGGWAAAVVLAVMFLPPVSATSSGGLSDLIPSGSAAAHAESDAARLFGPGPGGAVRAAGYVARQPARQANARAGAVTGPGAGG
jgi:hypothetical protein